MKKIFVKFLFFIMLLPIFIILVYLAPVTGGEYILPETLNSFEYKLGYCMGQSFPFALLLLIVYLGFKYGKME